VISQDIKKYLVIIFWALIVSYLFLLMIGPRVSDNQQEKYCVRNFEINELFGHSMNCDSADYMLNASNPNRLLSNDSVRQTRPGLMLVVFVLSHPFDFILKKFGFGSNYPNLTLKEKIDGSTIEVFEKFHPKIIYVIFAVLNFLILSGCMFFLFKIFGFSIFTINSYFNWFLWFSLLIVFNNITNQFFWSPSTKLLIIFSGVFSIFFSSKILNNEINKKNLIMICFVLGLMMLFYAIFILPFTICLLMYFVKSYKKVSKINLFLDYLLFIFSFLIPYATWYFYIFNINQSFYVSNFTNYKMVMWIPDYFEQQGLAGLTLEIGFKFFMILKEFFYQYWFLLLTIISSPFFYKKVGFDFKNPLTICAASYFMLYSFFFIVLNNIPSNIVTGLIVPVIILLITFLKQNQKNLRKKSSIIYFYSVIFCFFYFWSLIKFGPYS
tara:strand:- start:213 stop:1526 length:1314 start_codon:yes stop_codon:yes gene_type:complete